MINADKWIDENYRKINESRAIFRLNIPTSTSSIDFWDYTTSPDPLVSAGCLCASKWLESKRDSVRKGRCRSLKWCCHSLWGSWRKTLKSLITGLQQYPHLLLLMLFGSIAASFLKKEMKGDCLPPHPVTLSIPFVCPCNLVKGCAWTNDIVAH